MINYYGDKDNYIHLMFGDARKRYNFTEDFIRDHAEFVAQYQKYFMQEESSFKSPYDIVDYVHDNGIPVHFYYNFTDTPAEDYDEIISYLDRENA